MKVKNKNGITLVALVITIVILIILATIAINMAFGENGLIKKAYEAKILQDYATVEEGLYFVIMDENINQTKEMTGTEIMSFLKNGNYINDSQELNIEVLLGKTLSTGNGNNGKDVYKIEEGVLYYYNEQGEQTKINEIFIPKPPEPTEDEYFDFDPETGTISLKGALHYGSMHDGEFQITEIVVPSTYKGQEVKNIGNFTYKNIEKVVISEGITSIGAEAFGGAEKLKNIEIPDSVTSIGVGAFSMCSSLLSIEIPETVTNIETNTFYGCSSLSSMFIPGSVTSIGERAFFNCTSLNNIEILDGVTSIGPYAFQGCTRLNSIIIPGSVTSIEYAAFYGCSGLNSITIPSSVTSIGDETFYGCSGLSRITIPNSVTNIGSYVFSEWGSEQIINIEFATEPSGWNSSWDSNCNAQINWIG